MARRSLADRLKRLEDRSDAVTPRSCARRLRALDAHLQKARTEASPSGALRRANARAVLFQLEAIARAARKIVDDEMFEPVYVALKGLEDALGAVDFASGVLARIGAADDPSLRAYFTGRRAEACLASDRRLAVDGWWIDGGETSEAMDRVLDVIEDVRWPRDRKERRAYREYYADQATGIQVRIDDGGFDFDALEAGVHELRRRVRWLSILPGALDGLFVRDESQPIEPKLSAYCTPEIVASPYNRLPCNEQIADPIAIDSSAFLAMSWFIARVGEWKDRGQWSEALLGASRDLGDAPKAAGTRARRVLGDDLVTHGVVAKAVGDIAVNFVRDDVLGRLARSVEG